MGDNGDQLISFFLYSLLIYPITNYIVSPARKYARWKAALYAITFLLAISALHIVYENSESGPNHYQLLNVPRVATIKSVKRAYRALSLELHPDKNKAEEAVEEFQRVKVAFDVLSDTDLRREYDRMGDSGVTTAAHSVIDHKYIIIQLIVYYVSSLIFAFIMTFSEPTGDAFSISVFGLTVMLLIEMALVLKELPLPGWFLPYNTPYDVVATIRRLFPAFMNGCRCICGALYVDQRAKRIELLESLSTNAKDLSMRLLSIGRSTTQHLEDLTSSQVVDELDDCPHVVECDDKGCELGLVGLALRDVRKRVSSLRERKDDNVTHIVHKRVELISKPIQVGNARDSGNAWVYWILARNLAVYLLARFLFVKPVTA